jgi:hypothetical protein
MTIRIRSEGPTRRGLTERRLIGMTTRKIVYRSSKSGEFVTEKYADKHKATTEKEHVYVPAPKTK